jgi:hypothetical protein
MHGFFVRGFKYQGMPNSNVKRLGVILSRAPMTGIYLDKRKNLS